MGRVRPGRGRAASRTDRRGPGDLGRARGSRGRRSGTTGEAGRFLHVLHGAGVRRAWPPLPRRAEPARRRRPGDPGDRAHPARLHVRGRHRGADDHRPEQEAPAQWWGQPAPVARARGDGRRLLRQRRRRGAAPLPYGPGAGRHLQGGADDPRAPGSSSMRWLEAGRTRPSSIAQAISFRRRRWR